MQSISTIGVLTSGGDAPGMNACVRAVTRAAIYQGWKVYGIYRGWEGLIGGDLKEFTTESVSSTIQRGGTILKTARSEAFRTPEGRAKAFETIKRYNIDALIVIGGNGSLAGADQLAREFDLPVIGIPGTIDNDLYGTDLTLGYDTALNTIMKCVDNIRDTATSHDRIFFVEVMGRDAGFLAQNSAIAAGAEAAIIPEENTDIDQLEQFIERGIRKSKNSSIVLVSEKDGGAMHYAERVRTEYPQFDVRVSILGHLQRGGSPTAQDRILASRMGVASIEALVEGQRNVMIGVKNDEIVYVPIAKAIKIDKPIAKELINVLSILSI
ncbi:MAG: 6-phosphofructokinase [Bacteroidales bacterium]|nr:6-phosphofructokinase [Bacteroidales bacterium]